MVISALEFTLEKVRCLFNIDNECKLNVVVPKEVRMVLTSPNASVSMPPSIWQEDEKRTALLRQYLSGKGVNQYCKSTIANVKVLAGYDIHDRDRVHRLVVQGVDSDADKRLRPSEEFNGFKCSPLFHVPDLSKDDLLVVTRKPHKVLQLLPGDIPVLKSPSHYDVHMVQLVSQSERVLRVKHLGSELFPYP